MDMGSVGWVVLGLAVPLGSRTWWVLVGVLAALGVAGLLVFTRRR